MTATNPVYDIAPSCGAAQRGPVDTYCSPCNWASYVNGNDGMTAEPFALVGYIVAKVGEQGRKLAKDYTGDAWLVKPFMAFALFVLEMLTAFWAIIVNATSRVWPLRTACDTDKYRNAVANNSILTGFLGNLLGVPPALQKAAERRLNYNCPTEIPGPGELNAARLRGFVSKDQWDFGQKLNGQCVDWQERVYQTQQTVFTVPEIIKLWCTNVIRSDDLPNWFRANGVLDQKVVDGYKYLYEIVPGFADTLNAMVRNTQDKKTDELFGLSADFDERRTPQMDYYLQRSGYTRPMVDFLWRQQRQPISYRMIGSLYATGQIGEADLPTAFQAMGFTRKVSGWMVAMTTRANRAKRAALAGLPSLTELEAWYILGAINVDEYRSALLEQEVEAETVGAIVNRADRRRKAATIKAVQRWTKPKFVRGLIGEYEANTFLSNAGMDSTAANTLVNLWRDERDHSDKAFSLGELCAQVAAGRMDMDEYTERAKRLGWNELDAVLHAQTCNDKITTARGKEVERAQAKALRQAQKDASERSKNARALLKRYREEFPCKPRPKKPCPVGVDYPPAVKELENIAGS